MVDIKRGSELTLRIESLAFGGKGVARVDGFVLFVSEALPGELVRVRVLKKKNSYAEARCLEVLESSSLRVEPRCQYFGLCGGCRWQNLHYQAQLEYKRQEVIDSLERIGGFKGIAVEETLPSEDIYFYRNKMEFSFSDRRWLTGDEDQKPENFALGLHVPERYDKVLDIDQCYLQSESSNAILREVKEFALRSGLEPYSNKTHRGFWRFLVIREGKNTGETMVNLVTSREELKLMKELAARLVVKHPEIKSVLNNINSTRSSIAFGEREDLIYGRNTIIERVGDFSFEISANSFFQTNTRQTERLYQKVVELAGFQGAERVYDLYCGTGPITIFVSRYVKKVIGIEILEEAVRNAQGNCERNKVKNCYFVLGDVKDELPRIKDSYGRPQVVILDPPRAGVHPKVLKRLLELAPERIIYLSCNPTTLARDLKVLCKERYRIEVVQPVDMFPHTYHIETVSLLVRKK